MTRLVHRLSLGILEYPLSVIGSWFGIPMTSMALVPLLIVCAMEEGTEVWMLSFGGFFSAVCLVAWFYLLAKEKQEKFYSVSKTMLFLLILLVQVSCHYHSRRSSEVRRRLANLGIVS